MLVRITNVGERAIGTGVSMLAPGLSTVIDMSQTDLDQWDRITYAHVQVMGGSTQGGDPQGDEAATSKGLVQLDIKVSSAPVGSGAGSIGATEPRKPRSLKPGSKRDGMADILRKPAV